MDQPEGVRRPDRNPGADEALTAAQGLIRELLNRPRPVLSGDELLTNLRTVHSLAATVDAVKLAFVADLDTRPDAIPGARPGQVAATFLREGLRMSGPAAARDVAAAKAVASSEPTLPRMGAALADGLLSREHLDVGVSTLRRIPQQLKTMLIDPDPETADGTDPEADPAGDAGSGRDHPGEHRTGADAIDELLTGQAQELPPSTIERLGRQIVHLLDPDRAERLHPDAVQRRQCSVGTDFAGMGVYRLVVDPATHALLQAIVARWSGVNPTTTALTPDGQTVTVKDERTITQRRADGMVACLVNGDSSHPETSRPDEDETPDGASPPDDGPASAPCDPAGGRTPDGGVADSATGTTPDRAPDPPQGASETLPWLMARPCRGVQISVIATLDQLAASFGADDPAAARAGLARMALAGTVGDHPGATLHPAVLARLACDSPLHRLLIDPHGAVLHHGRSHRFATPAQRRALAARDGGCIVPGCGAPPEWTDAHHLIPWAEGGGTDVDAMVLLCTRHHTEHHAGIYQIQIRDGIPWVRLPSWRDPARPWLRNITRTHHHLATRTAAAITSVAVAGTPGRPPPPQDQPHVA